MVDLEGVKKFYKNWVNELNTYILFKFDKFRNSYISVLFRD